MHFYDKYKGLIKAIIVIIILICLLSFIPFYKLDCLDNCCFLKENLDAVSNLIYSYMWLFKILVLVLILAIVYIMLKNNFSIASTKITIAGFELQLKNTESKTKSNIKNHLSSKRAIFKINNEYDNYYDVINSMYQTFVFLRAQLNAFDNTDANEVYKTIENMLKEIGSFLTKYQSDYRRYYEMFIQSSDQNFVPFIENQKHYYKYDSMKADFKILNDRMCTYAKNFDIDVEKWGEI